MRKSQETREIFVGRDAELALARQALESSRVVAITGPFGVGKTALATALANAAAMIPLFGIRTEQEALFRIARAIGMIDLPAKSDEAIERVGRVLAGSGPMFLVLDHIDELDTAPYWVARWLDAAPELQVITTHQSGRHVGVAPTLALEPLSDTDATAVASALGSAVVSGNPLLMTVSAAGGAGDIETIVATACDNAKTHALLWLAVLGEVRWLDFEALVDSDFEADLEVLAVSDSANLRMQDGIRELVLQRMGSDDAFESLATRLCACFDEAWLDIDTPEGLNHAIKWFDLTRRVSTVLARYVPDALTPLASVYVRMCKWVVPGVDDLSHFRRAISRSPNIGLSVACMLMDIELGFIGRARSAHVDCLMTMTKLKESEKPEWIGRALQTGGARLAMHVDAKAAVERFEALAQTHPTMSRLEHLLDLGAARLAAFRVADANDAFQAAMDVAEGLDPRFSVRARLGLAQVSWRLGYTERARAQFEIALSQIPDGPLAAQTAHDYGVVLHHLGELSEARANLQRASRIWSTLGDERRLAAYHVRRGVLEMESEQTSLATMHFSSAAESARVSGDAHLMTIARACAAILKGEFDDKVFRSVEENVMVSRDPEAIVALLTVHGVLNDADKARDSLEAVVNLLGLEDVALRDVCDAALNLVRGDAPPLAAMAPMFRVLVRHARPSQPNSSGRRQLVIHAEAHWFTYEGVAVELIHRKPLRRILEALLNDWRAGGDGLTVDQVLVAGWPGEIVEARAGANRVYATVRLLRKAGLEDAIATEEGLYRLDPALDVHVSMQSEVGAAS
ncbi:MAG: tetratricopeptide repeat protein [bacterium]